MMQKRASLRMCVGCGKMKPKEELVWVVKAPEMRDEFGQIIGPGEISLDLTGRKPGCGAYVCKDIDYLRVARKSKRFERVFSCPISAEVHDRLEEEIGK